MIKRYFKRFNSINEDYALTDKHIHSKWSDGASSVLQILKEAERLKLTQIAITDHIRADSGYFPGYLKEIKNARKESDVEILAGFEAKIKNFDGDIDMSDRIAKMAQIKVASVHRFPLGRKLYEPCQFKTKTCQEIELELSVRAIKKRKIDVLGHPGGMSLLTYHDFPLKFFEEIIVECRKNNVAFELNSRYHSLILKGLKPLLKKYDVLVSLGSDAHDIKDIERSVNILKRITADG